MKGSADFKVCKASGNTCSIFFLTRVCVSCVGIDICQDRFFLFCSLAVSRLCACVCAQMWRVKRSSSKGRGLKKMFQKTKFGVSPFFF